MAEPEQGQAEPGGGQHRRERDRAAFGVQSEDVHSDPSPWRRTERISTGPPRNAVTMATGTSQDRSQDHRVEQQPQRGAGRRSADQVRHDQPDEEDRPGHRGRRPGEDGDQHQRRGPHPGDAGAQCVRHALAQREGVEGAAQQQRPEQACPDGGQRQCQGRLFAGRQRADGPEAVDVEDVGEHEPHAEGDAAEHRGEGHAGEDQAQRRGTPDRGDQEGRAHRAGDGEAELAGLPGGQAEGRADGDGEPGARGDPEDAGLGQRVAGQRLDQGARHRQRRAHGDGQQGAGRPDVPDDHVVVGALEVHQRPYDLGGRDRAGTDAGAEHGDHCQQQQSAGQQSGLRRGPHGSGPGRAACGRHCFSRGANAVSIASRVWTACP